MQSKFLKPVGLAVLIFLFAIGVCYFVLNKPKLNQIVLPPKQLNNTKIDSKIVVVIDNLKESDINPERISTSQVKVDPQGRIQVYIKMNTWNNDTVSNLEKAGLSVEVSNEELKLVQGWIHFSLVEKLASESTIRTISGPEYGTNN